MTELHAITKAQWDQAISDVQEELISASSKAHGSFNSYHEGYAVLLEKMDGLWDEIKHRDPHKALLRAKAKQVAAMAIRFMIDLI